MVWNVNNILMNTAARKLSFLPLLCLCFSSSSSLAQKGWQFAFDAGYGFMMPGYRSNDGVTKEYIYTNTDGFEALKVKGFNPFRAGVVLNYNFNEHSYIQTGFTNQFRLFRVTDRNINGEYLENGNPVFDGRIDYGPSSHRFMVNSVNFPVMYKRRFYLNKDKSLNLTAGIGLGYYVSVKNNAMRRRPHRLSYGYQTNKHYYRLRAEYSFKTDAYYRSNGDLVTMYSLGLEKTFPKKNRLELNIEFMDNFRGIWYEDYIEFKIRSYNAPFYVQETPDNIYNVSPTTTYKFYLQQGGLIFSLRYYPKPFTVNKPN